MVIHQIALAVFVGGMAVAFYAFIGYPCLTFLLARLADRRVARSPIEPQVTLIISAFNEAECIGQKLRDTLRLDYPRDKLEVIVASDGSTDQTDRIAHAYHSLGVRLIRTEGRVGKTATLDAAIRESRGEIIICSDATNRFNVGAVRALVANFADPTVGGVSGRVVYRYSDSLISRGFRRYQQFIVSQRMNESRFGHQTQLSGAIHAIRKKCYVTCPPNQSTEEWNAFQIASQGLRTVYEPAATAEEVSRIKVTAEFQARVRMALQCIVFAKYSMSKGLNRNTLLYNFQNLSSKIVRWLLPYVLLSIVMSSLFLASASSAWLGIAIAMTLCAVAAGTAIALPRLSTSVPGMPVLAFFTVVMCAFATAWIRSVLGGAAAAWLPERTAEKAASAQRMEGESATHHGTWFHR